MKSETESMGSGRKTLNRVGSAFFVVLGVIMIVSATTSGNIGGIIGWGLITLFAVRFYHRNFMHRAEPDPSGTSSTPGQYAAGDRSQAESNTPRDTGLNSSKHKYMIVLGVIGILLLLAQGASQNESNPSADALLADDTVKEYVASDFGFAVDFPGFPQRDDQTFDLEGYTIPYTTYMRETEGGEIAYMAAVWDYSSLPRDSFEPSLEGALNGMARTMDGQLRSTSTATLGGGQALEGTLSVPYEGKTYDAYARLTVKGMRMYGVLTMGAPYADFASFADSFRFTQ